MSALALKLIKENKRKRAAGEDATFLDLGYCGLTDKLPEELFECTWLEGLNFGDYYFDFEHDGYIPSKNEGKANRLDSSAIAAIKGLENIKALYLSDNQISDLSPLSAIASLNTLDLSGNQISDLSPLSAIASLNKLDLSGNQISDLSPLPAIASLTTLDLSGNQISDLSPLSAIASLNTLNLSLNQISDLSPLSAIASLNSLYLNSNQISDLSPLSAIASLNTLDLSLNQISDLSPLSAIASLNKLDLSGNQISDLSPLSAIASLTTLDLSYNQIRDLSPLSAIASLNTLNLRSNQISDLSPLSAIASLNSLYLSDNQISDLSPLSAIASLNSLYLSSNQISDLSPLPAIASLTTLDLSGNQISDLSPLSAIASLTTLYLSYNQISDLSPLSAIASLNTLYLGGNQISDLSPLSAIASLNTLYLGRNQIRDLSPLSAITSLNTLDLKENSIDHFTFSWLAGWPSLKDLMLSGNEIRNIPSAIAELDNCASALVDYIKGIEKEAVPVYESKLILIGNGRVGKTCLLKRMHDNTFDPKEPSTHAIQLREWTLNDLAQQNRLDDILLNVWDFGGQDIYHATHRMFMQTDALFLLVWDEETENTPTQTEVLSNGKSITYTNHPIPYWLSYVKALSNNSPVILVQSKMDAHPEASPGLGEADLKKFNVKYSLAVESSRETYNGFGSLKEKIGQVIRRQIREVCTALPAQWYRVRQAISEMQKAKTTCLSMQGFKALCQKEGLDNSSTQTLLQYLHNTGVVFYKKGLLGDQIIVDQKWAIDAVYGIFDRKGSFTKWHDKGVFTGEDLQEIWNGNYSGEYQQLFVDFMLRCEICFEADSYSNKPFNERVFIAPQLLPENKSIAVREGIESAFSKSDSVYMMCRHSFLHEAIIQRFIVRTSFIASNKEMWQHGVLLRPADGVALIEADPEKNEIMVRVKDGDKTLTTKIDNELDEITRGESGIETFYSFDGQNFVSIEKLKMHPVTNPQIQAENGTWLPFERFRVFLNKDENLRFEKPKDTRMKPKVFFSYAWNELSEELVESLYSSLKGDGYMVVRDKNDLGYKELITDFMKTIGLGDFVIVVISDKYLKSDYCMFEFCEVFRNSKLDTTEMLKKIYPIKVEFVDLNNPDTLNGYFDYWEKREAEFKKLVDRHNYDQEEYRRIKNIYDSLGQFLPFLKNINTSTKEMLTADNFARIKEAIKACLRK